MAGGIVTPIYENPFGTAIILKDLAYPNPNRFFCHWSLKNYFETTPLLLQKVVQPIDSVYLSCAIAKILIQLILIVLLSASITGSGKWFSFDFIIAAVLVTPLFQTNGYRSYMGIIDPSISYTFFYALPCALLLLYLWPFMLQYFHGKKPAFQWIIKIIWIPLAIVVCLSGPLNPGIVLVCSVLLFFHKIKNNYAQLNQTGIIKRAFQTVKNIPANYWFYFLPISLLSLYSLYLGRLNSLNVNIPLNELFSRIPEGIFYQFTQKIGFPILFLILLLNAIIIAKRFKTQEGEKLLTFFKWFGLFALLYILLLPFGGYRIYRPFVLRYDTIMPITLGLIFMFGATTLYIIKRMTTKQKFWYIPIIILILFIYTNSDEAQFGKNKCERIALKEIAASNDSIVQLHTNCTVLSWEIIRKTQDSELNAQLLNMWGITKEKKLYFNK